MRVSNRKGYGLELVENVDFKLKMTGSKYEQMKALTELAGIDVVAHPGPFDVVHISYQFTMQYWGVVEQLKALIELMETPGVSTVSVGDHDKKKFLIEEWLLTLRQLQEKLA